jgi:metal-dependent amidase/aminoacylase/carboxypeptidase family protein
VPGEDVADYYARRAAADVGLLVTEGTTVRRGGSSNDPNVPNFYKDDALKGWGRVVEKVHAEGGAIAPQIWHQGMVRKAGTGPNPDAPTDSPSGLTHTGKQVLPEPTTAEVDDMVLAYADAAAELVGADRVARDNPPGMGSEDFSFMLEERPGSYIFMGNGDSAGLHHPAYDFNDKAIPVGVSYWASIVETAMPA